MRRRYKKFARNTYRFLRNRRRRRENRFFAWLGKRVLNRGFWNRDRHSIAVGVAIGLAVAMLPPIPVQMLLAVIIAVLLRANIPIAAAACWLSNPLTWAPILVLQKTIGDWMLMPGGFDDLHPNYHALRCTALGAVVIAMVLAPLGYFFVYVLWDVVGWLVGRIVPVARKKTEPNQGSGADQNSKTAKTATTTALAATRTEP
jgi:uncharacterized protein (DUF2062 family)